MSHNKMYREIKGYEEALYKASDIIDEVEDLQELIRYGESSSDINEKVKQIELLLADIKKDIT